MNAKVASPYARGAIYGLAAVCIWASFIVVSRLGVTTGMTPWDIAAIRFMVAGLLLLPYLVRKGIALDRLGWTGVSAIAAGCGQEATNGKPLADAQSLQEIGRFRISQDDCLPVPFGGERRVARASGCGEAWVECLAQSRCRRRIACFRRALE